MTQVTGRRADQLRNLVTVLELPAVDLENRPRRAHQRFGHRLHNPGLAGAGGAQQKQRTNRPAGRRQTGEVHLIDVDDLADRFSLTGDPALQFRLEARRRTPILVRIQPQASTRLAQVPVCPFVLFGLMAPEMPRMHRGPGTAHGRLLCFIQDRANRGHSRSGVVLRPLVCPGPIRAGPASTGSNSSLHGRALGTGRPGRPALRGGFAHTAVSPAPGTALNYFFGGLEGRIST